MVTWTVCLLPGTSSSGKVAEIFATGSLCVNVCRIGGSVIPPPAKLEGSTMFEKLKMTLIPSFGKTGKAAGFDALARRSMVLPSNIRTSGPGPVRLMMLSFASILTVSLFAVPSTLQLLGKSTVCGAMVTVYSSKGSASSSSWGLMSSRILPPVYCPAAIESRCTLSGEEVNEPWAAVLKSMVKSSSLSSPPNVTARGMAGADPVNSSPPDALNCSITLPAEPSSVSSTDRDAKPMVFLVSSSAGLFGGMVMVCVVFASSRLKPSISPFPLWGMVRVICSFGSASSSLLISMRISTFPSAAFSELMRTSNLLPAAAPSTLASSSGPKSALPLTSMTRLKREAGDAETSSRTTWSSVPSLATERGLSNPTIPSSLSSVTVSVWVFLSSSTRNSFGRPFCCIVSSMVLSPSPTTELSGISSMVQSVVTPPIETVLNGDMPAASISPVAVIRMLRSRRGVTEGSISKEITWLASPSSAELLGEENPISVVSSSLMVMVWVALPGFGFQPGTTGKSASGCVFSRRSRTSSSSPSTALSSATATLSSTLLLSLGRYKRPSWGAYFSPGAVMM